MDANSHIQCIIGSLILSFTCHYMWKKILKINFNNNLLKLILSLLIMTTIMLLNYKFNVSYIKVASIIIVVMLIIRLFYSNNLKTSLVVSIVTEFIFIVSEVIFSFAVLVLFAGNIEYAMNTFFGTLLTNLCVALISVVLVNFSFVNKLYNNLNNMINKIKFPTTITVFLVLIISINICLAIPYLSISATGIVIINTVLMVAYSIIIYKYIEEKNRYLDISDKYSLSEASLKEVQNNVNRLMALNHENKNQLITIRTMVANKDKDVLKNIDAIIDQKIKDDKELKIRTSVISNTMLGSLIYSKLLTMKENNITHNLHISKSINKSHLINLGDKTNVDICKIVGVYLDNAIEAVMEADVKEINIDLYLEDNYFCISIANTFKGKVNLDTITDYGYTTKGKGHGYGLSLVKEVIKDNNALSSKTDIIDNKVFVQNLKIKM